MDYLIFVIVYIVWFILIGKFYLPWVDKKSICVHENNLFYVFLSILIIYVPLIFYFLYLILIYKN